MDKEIKTENYIKARLKVKDEYIKQLSNSIEQLKKELQARNKTIDELKRELSKERRLRLAQPSDVTQPLENW